MKKINKKILSKYLIDWRENYDYDIDDDKDGGNDDDPSDCLPTHAAPPRLRAAK